MHWLAKYIIIIALYGLDNMNQKQAYGPPTSTTNTTNHNNTYKLPITTTHSANSAYAMTSKASVFRYLHQCASSPTIATLTKAIDNGQFILWPGLTSAAVQKYLTPSPVADKGHMKRT